MENLRIIGWTNFDCVYPTKKLKSEELHHIIELIRENIRDNNYVFSGEEHQLELTGVPVFSDGTCFRASMRCWGNIMASIYAGPNGEELSYMDFYMSLKEGSIMPDYEVFNIEPAIVEEESIGCTMKQDREIINEAIALNMEFMTTDKVLKKLFEKRKAENNQA